MWEILAGLGFKPYAQSPDLSVLHARPLALAALDLV